jgi:hypothetical protein
MDQWSNKETSRRSFRWIESELFVSSPTPWSLLFQVFLGQFSTNLRMRMQKILDGGCAIRSVNFSSITEPSWIHTLALIHWIHRSHTSFVAVNQYRITHKYRPSLPSNILLHLSQTIWSSLYLVHIWSVHSGCSIVVSSVIFSPKPLIYLHWIATTSKSWGSEN